MSASAHLLDELRTLIARHAGPGETRTALPNIVLSAATLPTEPTSYMAEPALAIVVQGAKRVVLGDQEFIYSAGKYLVYSVALPLSAHIVKASEEGPLLGLGLMLKPERIASLLLEARAVQREKVDQRGIAVSDLTADLLDPVVRLLRLLDRPQDIPVLADSIEREILWRLINGEQGPMVRQLGLADSRMTQIGQAIGQIRSRYTDTIRIEDLATAAGMSVTSFYRHFRNVTSLSPLQFQKQIRLDAARTRLLSSSRDVAEIGLAVGYDSPSQFSREYRRLFGRPPGQDGEALRKAKVGTG